jgi:hypothetical protein
VAAGIVFRILHSISPTAEMTMVEQANGCSVVTVTIFSERYPLYTRTTLGLCRHLSGDWSYKLTAAVPGPTGLGDKLQEGPLTSYHMERAVEAMRQWLYRKPSVKPKAQFY